VEDRDLHRLVAAGLLDQRSPDASRLALLSFLVDRGATVDELVAAAEAEALSAVAVDRILRASTLSADDLASAARLMVAELIEAYRLLGIAVDDPTEPIFDEAEIPLAIGRSMTLRSDGQGWEVGELPDGLVSVLDEANTRQPSRTTHSLTFEGEAGKVELHSSTGSQVEMEDRIADYSVGAEVTTAVINGHAAAVARGPHDVRVLWYDSDNQVANYMIVYGAIADDVEQLLSNITELSEDEWSDLLATADTTYWNGDESSPTSTP